MQAIKNKLATLNANLRDSIRAAEEKEAKLADIISKADAVEALIEKRNTQLASVEDELDATESQLQRYMTQVGLSK